MRRSQLPLVAILGALGCTEQDTAHPNEEGSSDGSPWEMLTGGRFSRSAETAKGSSVRALTPEEREKLLPRPFPVPESATAQAAPAPEPPDAGVPPDYAEQRRQQYELRMRQLQEDAALRDAGIEMTPGEYDADLALATGPMPKDLAGQRRYMLAKIRLEEAQRKYRYDKGSGIKRSEELQFVRGTDGGTDGGTLVPANH